MTRVLIAGYQHETNTFAPSLADWAAFNRGDSFPAFVRGPAMPEVMGGINIPVAGFIDAARRHGWTLVPSCWAGAIPSSYVTRDAFERIAAAVCEDALTARDQGGLDAVYLDLHGAAVASTPTTARASCWHGCAGSSDRRCRSSPASTCTPTSRGACSSWPTPWWRTAPTRTSTWPRPASAPPRCWRAGSPAGAREPMQARRLPFLIPLNAQSTWLEPARGVYAELAAIDREPRHRLQLLHGLSRSDFDECGPMLWSHGARAGRRRTPLRPRRRPGAWQLEILPAKEAVVRALALAEAETRPVVVADTQDNPGAGGDSNTTGLLHALLAQGAGRRFPGQVALGLMFDPAAARAALEAGIGAELNIALGTACPHSPARPATRRCVAGSRCWRSPTASAP
jgi:microcystin degradation protein MlrC